MFKIECCRCHYVFDSEYQLSPGDVERCDLCRDYLHKYIAMRTAEDRIEARNQGLQVDPPKETDSDKLERALKSISVMGQMAGLQGHHATGRSAEIFKRIVEEADEWLPEIKELLLEL